MKQQTRELLVTTKVAQNWQDDFEQKIDELMSIVSKVDTEQEVLRSSEKCWMCTTTLPGTGKNKGAKGSMCSAIGLSNSWYSVTNHSRGLLIKSTKGFIVVNTFMHFDTKVLAHISLSAIFVVTTKLLSFRYSMAGLSAV